MLIKVYQNMQSDTVINSISEIKGIRIKEDLSSYWVAEIDISTISWLRQFQKIEVVDSKDWKDIVLFWWYINELSPHLDWLKLICKDYKAFFSKMVLYSNKDYNDTIENIINDFIWEYNSRASTSYTVETDIWNTVNKSFKKWDNYFDMITEICNQLNIHWNVVWNVVNIKEIIWEDKSIPESSLYEEVVYNINDPAWNNIISMKQEQYWTIINALIGKDDNGYAEDTDWGSISNYWRIEWFKAFRDWDLSEQVDWYIEESKEGQIVYTIEVNPYMFNANIWDKVKLRIYRNEYMDTEWSVYVLTKEKYLENGSWRIKYWFSEHIAKINTLWNNLRDMKKDIELLKLKTWYNSIIPWQWDMYKSTYDNAWINEQLVWLTATQTLTNKTLTNPLWIVKWDVWLWNVDNTSDINKPISTATQTALDLKQDNLWFTPENIANKWTINWYASLDWSWKVPTSQLPYNWDVTSSANITDNCIVRWDWWWKWVQGSSVTIDDDW